MSVDNECVNVFNVSVVTVGECDCETNMCKNYMQTCTDIMEMTPGHT